MTTQKKCTCQKQTDLSNLVIEAAAKIAALEVELKRITRDRDRLSAVCKQLQVSSEAAEAKLSKAVEALERIRNENQVRYIQIGDDPNENGPTIQIDGPFAKIANAALKEIGGDDE